MSPQLAAAPNWRILCTPSILSSPSYTVDPVPPVISADAANRYSLPRTRYGTPTVITSGFPKGVMNVSAAGLVVTGFVHVISGQPLASPSIRTDRCRVVPALPV